jgi:hypothetical protein
VAQLTTAALPAGTYTFTAVYSGDSKHDISVGSATVSAAASAAMVVHGGARPAAAGHGGPGGVIGGPSIRVALVVSFGSTPAPVSAMAVAIDKALGQWNGPPANGGYAELALAMLLDLDSGSDRAEGAPLGRRPVPEL